jgi:ankyrin repeat protein
MTVLIFDRKGKTRAFQKIFIDLETANIKSSDDTMTKKGIMQALLIIASCLVFSSCITQTGMFHMAIKEGHGEKVKAMINRKIALVRERDYEGWTPLHTASFYGRLEIAQLLIDHGADVRAADNSGETPLHLAAEAGLNSRAIAELLIAKGAPVNARSDSGCTPLHNAVMEDDRALAEALARAGADIDAKNEGGEKALDIARKLGKKNCSEFLAGWGRAR